MSVANLTRHLTLAVLALLVLTGTVVACTGAEFDRAVNTSTEETAATVDCEQQAFNDWVAEYGTVTHRTMDGRIVALPRAGGLLEYMDAIELCEESDLY